MAKHRPVRGAQSTAAIRVRKVLGNIALLATLSFAAGAAEAQDFVWAKRIGGTLTDRAADLALDASRNVYTTGSFGGTVDFDPGPGVFNMTARNGAVFVSKLNRAGRFDWARKMGGAGFEQGSAIAVGRDGHIYVTGFFEGTADFDPGPAIFNLTAAGEFDIFICKLDSGGSFVWAKRIGGTQFDTPTDLALDDVGNVYTVGTFRGTVDFDPGPGVTLLTATPSPFTDNNAFVSKLNSAGNFVWAKQLGSSGGNVHATVDGAGNPYVASDPFYSDGFVYVVVSKLTPNGGIIRTRTLGPGQGESSTRATVIVTDAQDNILVVGAFSGNGTDFDPGPGTFILVPEDVNTFVWKLNSAGSFILAKKIGFRTFSSSLSVAAGNIYITGSFTGAPDFDPGPGTFTLLARNSGGFVVKLSSSGTFAWAAKIDGALNESSEAIAVDGGGNVYVAGQFQDVVDFDPGPGASTRRSAGLSDIFVTKWSQP
jgi:hypothetical protein